ncbi:hypothetical protein GE061_019126 [Apolygus lucorum]|uniref:Uncharacterized protein n=1 Tax=Apolygus lucorum TaxID=248454 RepID=A0A8S9X8U1_APOLU|nr:hypothetical protein GE061_019126 [Apolygus lucorum]
MELLRYSSGSFITITGFSSHSFAVGDLRTNSFRASQSNTLRFFKEPVLQPRRFGTRKHIWLSKLILCASYWGHHGRSPRMYS